MSYDVTVGDVFSGNYTRNLSKLFHEHIQSGDDTGLQALHGLTGAEALMLLSDAFDRLQNTRRYQEDIRLAQYDAPNSWGTAMGAVIFLGQIMAACAKYPNEKVSVFA